MGRPKGTNESLLPFCFCLTNLKHVQPQKLAQQQIRQLVVKVKPPKGCKCVNEKYIFYKFYENINSSRGQDECLRVTEI